MKVILLSVLLSCVFRYVPGITNLGNGWIIIICGVVSAGLGAWFFPLRTKDEYPQDQKGEVR